MGTLVLTNGSLLAMLGEALGYKSGLALSRDQILEHLKASDPDEGLRWEDIDPEEQVRIRSEDVSQLLADLLHSVGAAPTARLVHPVFTVLGDYARTSRRALSESVADLFTNALREAAEHDRPLDATAFMASTAEAYGLPGVRIGEKFISNLNLYLQQAMWDRVRLVAWDNPLKLESLFKSESLTTQYGSFLDQRIIDYLGANFDSIDSLNWRKFEGLVAEFLKREGYTVDLGEGRGDGGVDVRAWRDGDRTAPPAVLVQCKRQQAAVPQVVIKALYADVLAEGATSGLVVTTSGWEPAAKRVSVARSYPVHPIERNTLRQWVEAMRTPWAGV